MKLLSQLTIKPGMKILLRLDLNVPIAAAADGTVQIADLTRLTAAKASILHCLGGGARVIIASHFGRPDSSRPAAAQPQFSLRQLLPALAQTLGREVAFAADLAAVPHLLAQHDCVLLENVRFLPGETANAAELAQNLARLAEVFVMDAFGSAHRVHASTAGVVKYAKLACAGLLVEEELAALARALGEPARPLLAIAGGAKVSDKLKLLEQLSQQADALLVGGGIANTFLAANGRAVGKSLYEPSMLDVARSIMAQTEVLLPQDVVVAHDVTATSEAQQVPVTAVPAEMMILDVGVESQQHYAAAIQRAATIIWNGPLGVFEQEAFAAGTAALVQAISQSSGYVLAGGGETVAALNKFKGQVTYASTAGGAFLQYLEQGSLPVLEALAAAG